MTKKRSLKYTDEHLDFLRRYCRDCTDKQLVHLFKARFGVTLTLGQIKGTRSRHKMLTGRDGRFKPGNVPHPLAGAKSANKTSFKPGQKPANYMPIGSERITKKDNLLQVKVADPNKWRSKHALIWESHHGKPIPKGHIVRFLDGDQRNFDPDNLLLVSRRENVVFNKRGYCAAPAETKPALHQIVKLDLAIKDTT